MRNSIVQGPLTCTEVDSVEQTANPSHLADALAEIVDELGHEDTEAVGDAVHDHVTDEGGGDDDPAVAAVRGCWNLGKLQVTHVHVGDTVTWRRTETGSWSGGMCNYLTDRAFKLRLEQIKTGKVEIKFRQTWKQ